MLIIPEPKRRKRKDPPRLAAAPALSSASFDPATAALRLSFDKPVNASALVGGRILVDDSSTGTRYQATGPLTVIGPDTIQIETTAVQALPVPATTLTASAASGIVSAHTWLPWPGATALPLPYPQGLPVPGVD